MSTWKYGPITVSEDTGLDWEDHEYLVQYQTTADVLGILRDGKWAAGFGYNDSRVVGGMIMEWYLFYVLGIGMDDLPETIKKDIENRRKKYKKEENGTQKS
jgi:hypothetical protein